MAPATPAGPSASHLTPPRLAELIALVARGSLSKGGARGVLAAMLARDESPERLVTELGLAQVSDAREIEDWCRSALTGAERAVADVRAGEMKALGALIGRVMKASLGRANPELVRATLLRLVQEA